MPGLSTVFDAFWELSTERQSGWSAGEIPYRAIKAWASDYGIHDLDAFDEFRALIRIMDAAFLNKITPVNPNDKTAQVSGRELTMDLFDALFD